MSFETVTLKEYEKKTVNDSNLQECILAPLEKYLEKNNLTSALRITSNGIKARCWCNKV